MTSLNCDVPDTAHGSAQPHRFLLLRSLLARLLHGLAARTEPAPRKTAGDPWVSAIDTVAEMDAHMLKDIGAPAWLVAEVSHRQNRAAKRLTDLRLR
ncbi:MAG: hypothetical protein WBA83_17290 [Burkholderiaceae bacterium]